MNRTISIFMLLMIPVISSCQLIGSLRVRFVDYPSPSVETPSMAAFEQAGCTIDEDGWWVCPDDSPITLLGCDRIKPTEALLGALEPARPIAECLYYPTQHLEDDQAAFDAAHLYSEGCLLPVYVRYVIFEAGEFITLNSLDDLKMAFAPLRSPEEALAYAAAATGLQAKFDLKRQANFRYLTDRLEDSHAIEATNGFDVLLYHYQVCGCGPHTTTAVWFEVNQDGSLREISRTPAYENPEEDNLCVD